MAAWRPTSYSPSPRKTMLTALRRLRNLILLINWVCGKTTPMNPKRWLANSKWQVLFALFAALGFVEVRVSANAQNAPTLDETAHVLAGLPTTGALASISQTNEWKGHAAEMDKAWKTKEFFQLGPIGSWMSSHAGEYYRSSGTMYYMFSGPD